MTAKEITPCCPETYIRGNGHKLTMKPSHQHISNAFEHMPHVGRHGATMSMSFAVVKCVTSSCEMKPRVPWYGSISEVRWSCASLHKGRKPKLNTTPHPLHRQQDNLEVRAGCHVEAITPKAGSLPLQDELSKCNSGG